MELGFFTMPLHPPGSDTTKTLDDDLEQMIVLDELGYKEAYVGEHFTFTWENIPSPDLFIAKAAALTENIIFRHRDHLYADTQSCCCGASHRATGSPNARALSLGGSVQVPHRAMRRCSWQTGTDGSLPEKGLMPYSKFGQIQNRDITRPTSGNLRSLSTARTL